MKMIMKSLRDFLINILLVFIHIQVLVVGYKHNNNRIVQIKTMIPNLIALVRSDLCIDYHIRTPSRHRWYHFSSLFIIVQSFNVMR